MLNVREELIKLNKDIEYYWMTERLLELGVAIIDEEADGLTFEERNENQKNAYWESKKQIPLVMEEHNNLVKKYNSRMTDEVYFWLKGYNLLRNPEDSSKLLPKSFFPIEPEADDAKKGTAI